MNCCDIAYGAEHKFCYKCGSELMKNHSAKVAKILNTVISERDLVLYYGDKDNYWIVRAGDQLMLMLHQFGNFIKNYNLANIHILSKTNDKTDIECVRRLNELIESLGPVKLYYYHCGGSDWKIHTAEETIKQYPQFHYLSGIDAVFSETYHYKNIEFRRVPDKHINDVSYIYNVSKSVANMNHLFRSDIHPIRTMMILFGIEKPE